MPDARFSAVANLTENTIIVVCLLRIERRAVNDVGDDAGNDIGDDHGCFVFHLFCVLQLVLEVCIGITICGSRIAECLSGMSLSELLSLIL